MIRRIVGEVVSVERHGELVVDVRGVGYIVRTTPSVGAMAVGNEVALWTHLAVRETALDLYGFLTRDELEVFELLLTLPEVGPKSALQILAQADIALLKQAVAEQDASYLAKLSGIGKKTAEKIVTELKDKFADLYVDGGRGFAAPAALPQHHADIVDALVALGYSAHAAREAARALPPDVTNPSDAIKHALKELHTN